MNDMFGNAITNKLETLPPQLQNACQATIVVIEQLVSQPVTTNQFYETLVKTIHTVFDLYSANLYTIEAHGRWAILKAGTSDFAQLAIQKGHRLPLDGLTLIAKVAKTNQSFAAFDLGQDETEYASPVFSPVKSQLVVPIMLPNEDTSVGVLDIQSDKHKAFEEAHFVAFSIIATCIAHAFRDIFPNKSFQ